MTRPLTPFYKTNGKFFSNKIDAIMEANSIKADITWDFYSDVLSKVDWSCEPAASLDSLYKDRATSIREAYDYVVVLCSGGADSTNVLRSFLKNGIRVDEVIASAPLEGLRDYKFNSTDTSHNNTISETLYAQMPLIREISQKYTDVKITIHDYFRDILDYKTDDWLLRCDDWIHPSSAARYRFERHAHLRDLADSGKRVAFVYGIDKPHLVLSDEKDIYTVFSDLAVNVARPPFDRDYTNVDTVMFYWDHSCTNLLVKQAHVLMRWLLLPENNIPRSYLHDTTLHKHATFESMREMNSKFQRAIVPCIYESTHTAIFQAEKPTKLFLGEHDNWFYKHHSSTMSHQMMVSDTRAFYKTIDKKYLNSAHNGFKIYNNNYLVSKFYNSPLLA
jgi:hypothetical protein